MVAYAADLGATIRSAARQPNRAVLGHAVATASTRPELMPPAVSAGADHAGCGGGLGGACGQRKRIGRPTANPLCRLHTSKPSQHVGVPHAPGWRRSIPLFRSPPRYALRRERSTIANYNPRASGQKRSFTTPRFLISEIEQTASSFSGPSSPVGRRAPSRISSRSSGGKITRVHRVEAIAWGDIHLNA